ncbi:MAG: hypothetical protein RSA66_09485 [Muribaculaceae bacterium]
MTDIQLKEGDVLLANGDLAVGDSDAQHQEILLICSKGEFKEHPDRGVNAIGYIEDCDTGRLVSAIREEYFRDGIRINKISIINSKIEVDAQYRS